MQRFRHLSLVGLPAIATAAAVWIGAVLCLIGAQDAVRVALQGQLSSELLSAQDLPKIITKLTPLTEPEYKAVAAQVPMVPGVAISGGASGVTVEARELGNYDAWQSTVSEVMLAGDGVTWEVKNVCTGECQGNVFTVTITGVRRATQLNS